MEVTRKGWLAVATACTRLCCNKGPVATEPPVSTQKGRGTMRNNKFITCNIFFATICFGFMASGEALAELPELNDKELLGQHLYFDEDLSQPSGQSCASCHNPDFGFVDPDTELPVSEGVLPNRFGGRNSPSAGYAMYAPSLHFDGVEELWIGGQFWDGRATGNVLGDPLADQALGPFLNPVEMSNKRKKKVVTDVAKSEYAQLFEQVWGTGSLDDIEVAYDKIALSVAAFERTEQFAPFNSRYDQYLQLCLENGGIKNKCAQGKGKIAKTTAKAFFTKQEWKGFKLFMRENNNDGIMETGEGAMCSACHVADWTPNPGNVVAPSWSPDGSIPPMFTDFTYDNIGVPKNVEFPFVATSAPDLGLGPIINDPDENGKFRVMSLRNISLTSPYTHNGLFKTLKEVTHFYNTRDVEAENWPEPEYPATVNDVELGNLGLSPGDEDALASFMMTLSDEPAAN